MARETGWLIERKGEWWMAGPCSQWEWERAIVDTSLWTNDANKALRFAREQDAQTMIHFEGFQNAEATEHIWVDGVHDGHS